MTKPQERYELERTPILAARWEHVYGWSAEEAERLDGSSSEVRLYHVTSDGKRRDLAPGRDGGFEFGYGGTGPHESAAAIVHDITGEAGRWREHRSPAELRRLVPEVFTRGHDKRRLVILAAAVRQRLSEPTFEERYWRADEADQTST